MRTQDTLGETALMWPTESTAIFTDLQKVSDEMFSGRRRYQLPDIPRYRESETRHAKVGQQYFNRMKIAQMIVNFGNFMSSILICHCSVFFYLFPWCLLICLCGIVLICSVMSLLLVPVKSFDLSLRCRFDLSLGGVWPNSQVEPRMKWGGCPFPTHWLLAKVFFLLIFSSKVFHRQYWQKIASSFFSFLIGSLKEPINLNIFFDALTY